MRIWAASASKFLIKRRADFIGFTAAMLSDPESLSDPEVFVGFFRDTARPCRSRLRYAYICRAGETIRLIFACSLSARRGLGTPTRHVEQ